MSFDPIKFFVPGTPATAGSKKAFVNKRTGKAHLVDTCVRGPGWRQAVQYAALVRRGGAPLIAEAVTLRVTFVLPRPRSHFRSGKAAGQLRADAPRWHTSRPDATKLVRAAEDALKDVIWTDDSLVVSQFVEKVYGDNPGASVEISPAPP